MNKKSIASLMRFLKDARLYTPFVKNYDPRFEMNGVSLQEYLKHVSDEQCIDSAFSWANSPEGHDFWETINGIWEEYTYDKDFVLGVKGKRLYEMVEETKNAFYFI